MLRFLSFIHGLYEAFQYVPNNCRVTHLLVFGALEIQASGRWLLYWLHVRRAVKLDEYFRSENFVLYVWWICCHVALLIVGATKLSRYASEHESMFKNSVNISLINLFDSILVFVGFFSYLFI